MQAVILSIRKEWARLILSGDKTLEIRRTKPNYCAFTISKAAYPLRVFLYESKANGGRGMVVGWVDCEGVTEITADADAETVRATAARACLRVQDFDTYRRGHKPYILTCWNASSAPTPTQAIPSATFSREAAAPGWRQYIPGGIIS